MSKDPFLKAFDELLEDQIDLIRFEKISRKYAANETRKDEIMKTLEFLPATVETKLGPVKVHKLLAVNKVNELEEGLQKTFTAVNSDALVAGLEVYAIVKQNRDKVPGLNVTADEMAEFFQKPARKSASSTAASQTNAQ